jgi:ribosomal protein L3 glutamine methyltransferase
MPYLVTCALAAGVSNVARRLNYFQVMNPTIHRMTVIELIEQSAQQLEAAGVGYGHGTANAFDEAAWLVLWALQLPLDDLDSVSKSPVAQQSIARVATILRARIDTRKPAAYLTQEAWLQGVPFYVDERVIVPRSFIAELLADGSIDPWLGDHTTKVLDLCTGNGSLAILAAMAYPDVSVDAADISTDALAVAQINVEKHALASRIKTIASDGLAYCHGPYDLVLCNPPYVNSTSMAALPAEYLAEPQIALAGGADGMDFIRPLLRDLPAMMSPHAVLVLEIGNERAHFEHAFPTLEVMWLDTSAGEDVVLLITREAMARLG